MSNTQPTQRATDPAAIASRVYPNAPYLQAEYMRAVQVVRATSRGWLLDKPIARHGSR